MKTWLETFMESVQKISNRCNSSLALPFILPACYVYLILSGINSNKWEILTTKKIQLRKVQIYADLSRVIVYPRIQLSKLIYADQCARFPKTFLFSYMEEQIGIFLVKLIILFHQKNIINNLNNYSYHKFSIKVLFIATLV